MQILICDGTWLDQGGAWSCSGQLQAVAYQPNGNPAITAEDRQLLWDQTLVLFAIVFGVLAVKKAISER